jgi:uncharacterized protein (DUF849 family)
VAPAVVSLPRRGNADCRAGFTPFVPGSTSIGIATDLIPVAEPESVPPLGRGRSGAGVPRRLGNWHTGRMRLQACVNGARRPVEHLALPVTPAALAAEVRAVTAAGADGVHLHVKDSEGVDTLDGGALTAVLSAVRLAAPGVAVGVTTGAWAVADPAERIEAVRGWTSLPDFASVNWHEPGAEQVATTLADRGVGVEAGLWDAAAVAAWLASPLRDRCLRVLLELPDGLDNTATRVEAVWLLDLLSDGGCRTPVLLHGEGSSCWPALQEAGRRGLATRVGLEDTLTLPDGSPATDNVALLDVAHTLLTAPR